tara:strand:- start:1169 stop:1459 length:291 start_codon:yes stop_codon:yes gene_type:complete
MTRYHATVNGNVEYSSAEESTRDAEEKAWADGSAARAWTALRIERDRKLFVTDWRAMSDVTLADAWKVYRKALRDFPATLDDTTVLEEITWPTEPG